MATLNFDHPEKIDKAAQFCVVLNGFPEFSVRVVAIPPATGVTHELGYDHDDRTIGLPNHLGSLWVYATRSSDGAHVAQATFAATEKSVLCDTVDVEEPFRGKGLATALYDLAEQVFQVESQPSQLRSDDAKTFWARRLSKRQTG